MTKRIVLIEVDDNNIKDLKMICEQWKGLKFIGEYKGADITISGMKKVKLKDAEKHNFRKN